MTARDQMATDMADVFLNEDEFAEPVTWTPSGGDPVDLSALVTREPTEPEDGPNGLQNRFIARVTFAAADVVGLARGDKLALPKEFGGTAVDWTVMSEPENEGSGAVRVRAFHSEPIELSTQSHRSGI